MSMLAERRRKTKWVINPTKKPLWTTESNGIKFGKELMEKMGWSAGKGLGAKEQGIQEPLRVSYKNDTKGMGFKGNDDDWIEQQDEFNVLLNQLRNSDDSSVVKVSEEEKNEIKSLEEKSKQSRARVHYQKFTRGKDLSRYSENDLACILGTNKMKKEKSKTEEVVEEKSDGLVTSFGVTTINSGSIQDYFKKKWITDKFQSKNAEKEEEEYSCDERPSFSRVCGGSEEFSKEEHKKEGGALNESEMHGDSAEKYEKKKRKKKDVQTSEEEEPKSKRTKSSDQDSPVDEELQNLAGAGDEVETKTLLQCENTCDSGKRKKEKRKSKKEEGLDGNEEAEGLEVKKKRKKDRKEKPIENGYCDTEELASVNCNLEPEDSERNGELVKKKKRGESGNKVFDEAEKENVEEPSLEISAVEMNNVVEGDDVMVTKGKKKRKYKDCSRNVGVGETDEKNELGKISLVCEGDTEVESKKKKKKKDKQHEKVECFDNENGISCEIQEEKCDSESNCNSITDSEVKKKKKKKEEAEGDKVEFCRDEIESSSYENCNDENNCSNTVELEVKKKKKKKEKLEGSGGECSNNGNEISNETQVEKCDAESNSNNIPELEEECKKKKKKKQKQDKVECCNGLSSEIQVEKYDSGSNSKSITDSEVKKKKKKKEEAEGDEVEFHRNEPSSYEKCDGENNSNSTVELEEVKKKKKKKEKQEGGKVECSNNGNEIQMEKYDIGNSQNNTPELEEFKKKKKKKEKQDKVECYSELPSEIPLEKPVDGNNSISPPELEEVKKKRKKKEKEEDKMVCNNNGNEISSEIPLEKPVDGNNSINPPELEEVKKKKKKDKHKTEESCLDEAHQESIKDFCETVQKEKKKKDKKKKQKSKEDLNAEQKSKKSRPDKCSTNSEAVSDGKREKKKWESERSEKEGEKETKAVEKLKGNKGNAQIGTTAGIDKVEQISQRAAYEHVAGQHRYERVKKMIEFVNLKSFKGSNLEGLDGYGSSLRRCEPSVR